MIVLVVGGGKKHNIGWGIANKLYHEGHEVIIADIDYDHEDRVQLVVDVTSEVSVEKAFQYIKRHYGQLDAIVNSAGVNILGKLEDYSLEDFHRTIDVNLTSNFLLLREYKKVFGGDGEHKSFIAITSDTGMIPKSSTFAYGASKAGANHFIRCAARELNKYGGDSWQVTALAIGRVYTPMDQKTIRDLMDQRGISFEEAEAMLSINIPVARGMYIEEVAEWTYFVLTKGQYATGNVLRIDAGQVQG